MEVVDDEDYIFNTFKLQEICFDVLMKNLSKQKIKEQLKYLEENKKKELMHQSIKLKKLNEEDLVHFVTENTTSVDLSMGMKLTQRIEKILEIPKTLTLLDLSRCTLKIEQLNNLIKMIPMVKELNLQRITTVNDEFISKLMISCKHLVKLDLRRCTKISAKSLESLSQAANLVYLNLSNNPKIAGNALIHLKSLNHLRYLNLSRTNIDSENFQKIISSLGKLKEIYLNGCKKIDNQAIESIVKYCKELNCLDIANIKFTEELGVLSQCIHLEYLCLSSTKPITDDFLGHLSHLTNLKELYLTSCTTINDLSFIKVISKINHLKSKKKKIRKIDKK